MEENRKEEISFTNHDGSVNLKALITGLTQKMLGKALDYARISGMSDRSFAQYQRSLKDDFYVLNNYALRILADSGDIPQEDVKSDR
jgi:hypothetical protein